MNIIIVNNTGLDIRDFEGEIVASLKACDALPEELSDLFVVTRLDGINADGSPRYRLDNA